MNPSQRSGRAFLHQQPGIEASAALPAARKEYVRIARALLGVTPAQLAAHIGVMSQAVPEAETARPAHTLERLGSALQAVIGWYHDTLHPDDRAIAASAPVAETGLDDLVQKYIALRSDWENREATSIAARMTERAAPSKSRVVPPSAVDPNADVPRPRALLVDDASDVVVTVGAFLEAFGFDVRRASNGDTALAILADGTRIDLLVSDHAMPGLTGKDLVTQACLQRPGLRALIITGYPDADDLSSLPERVMLLAKPFRRLELAERIHHLFAENVGDHNSRANLQEADGQ